MKSSTTTHAIGLGLAMLALWLLLSGHYDPLLLGFGIASTILVVVIAIRLDVIDHEAVPLHLHLGWFGYIAWLGREIAKANWAVARIVVSRRMPISPTMVWVPAPQRTEVGKVIYANSITLTPGTVSIEIEDGHILVHALTREAAEDVKGGEMGRRVNEIEAR